MLFPKKGNPGTDRSATAGFRLDGKRAAHSLHSLPHAYEPQAATAHGVLLVKANSQVIHRQLYPHRCSVQFHSEVSLTAVLNCILQTFL